MVDIEESNKLSTGVIAAVIIIGGLLYWGSSDDTNQQKASSTQISQKTAPNESIVNFQEAPNHIGEYVIITGLVDSVVTSSGGTNFLNFCPNYRTCPFSAVIFNSDTYKFSNIRAYENKIVEISGIISTYQGRAQIIIKSPSQVKFK